MGLLRYAVNAAFKIYNRRLILGRGVSIDPRAFAARGGAVTIGNDSVVRAGVMLLPSGGSIRIGSRSSLNHYTVINGQGGVVIGDDVLIAAFVSIFAGMHRMDDPARPIREQGMTTRGGIIVEDDVWIGTHCVILDGVRIGKGSVIAAGAVVTRDVAPYSVVAGVPARVIRNRLSGAASGDDQRSQDA